VIPGDLTRIVFFVSILFGGCAESSDTPQLCEEDPRSQILEPALDLVVSGIEIRAEVAETDNEQARGWKYRRCNMEALWLPNSEESPLPIWNCDVTVPLDILFVHNDVVVGLETGSPTCSDICDTCPIYGEDLIVHGVLELPHGHIDVNLGDVIEGLP
jgi:uncharacterized membrane protein (UPF0127 family)